jgi:hypothetical protein
VTDKLLSEGAVVLPKRMSLIVVLSALAFLLGQTIGLVWAASKLDSRIGALEESDNRILGRGNDRYAELRGRIEVLERDRDRLARVEEKVGFIWEAVREMSGKLDRKGGTRP